MKLAIRVTRTSTAPATPFLAHIEDVPVKHLSPILRLADQIYRSMKSGQAFGDELEAIRALMKIDDKALSRAIGFTPARINGWEKRVDWERKIDPKDAKKFGDFFGLK